MKTLSFVLLFLLFSVSLSFSQPPDTLWTRVYGGSSYDEATSVQQTSDGGYILAGYTTSFGAGYYDFWLLKTDAQGDSVWSRTFGGSGDDKCFSVQQTIDGGYILAGYTTSFSAGYDDFWLIKTNAQGDSVWSRTFGGWGGDNCRAVQQTTDGGYILAGITTSYGAGYCDFWLVKTDGSGDSLWSRAFGGRWSDLCFSVQQTSDNGYILAGYTESFGAGSRDFWLVKADGNGNQLWTRTFGTSLDDQCFSVQQTTDGGYILAGIGGLDAGPSDFWLVKTDGGGDSLWSRTFGGSSYDLCFSVQQTSDGGYIMAGYSESFVDINGDFWLVKTDGDGDSLWSRTFGGSSRDECFSVQQASDAGYILAGYTDSFSAGYYDFWLVKTGPDIDSQILYEIHIDQVTLNCSASYAFNFGLTAGDFLDITGHVTNLSTGQPIPNFALGVDDELGAVCRAVTTDAQGNFTDRITVAQAFSHFNHQVCYYRVNAWPVYLAIPAHVETANNLLLPPNNSFILEALNAHGIFNYSSLTTADGDGNWLWTLPNSYMGGIKTVHSVDDVNQQNCWEILKFRYWSGTDPFIGHPEIYQRANEVAYGRADAAMTQMMESSVNNASHFLRQNVASVLTFLGAGAVCAVAGPEGYAACELALGVGAVLDFLFAVDGVLTAWGASQDQRDRAQDGLNVAIALFSPIRTGTIGLDAVVDFSLIFADEGVLMVDARPTETVIREATVRPLNFTNSTLWREWDVSENELDEMQWHCYLGRLDWGDTTYVIGIMYRYDAAHTNTQRTPAHSYSLSAFPNPFNPTTTISFSLPKSAQTRLVVFDLLGREVAVLTDHVIEAGEHRMLFDGAGLPSGLYFARLQSGEFSTTQKLLLVK